MLCVAGAARTCGGLRCHDPERARGCRRCWAEGSGEPAHRAGVVRWLVSGAERGGRSSWRHAAAVGGSGVFRGRTRQPGLRSLGSVACRHGASGGALPENRKCGWLSALGVYPGYGGWKAMSCSGKSARDISLRKSWSCQQTEEMLLPSYNLPILSPSSCLPLVGEKGRRMVTRAPRGIQTLRVSCLFLGLVLRMGSIALYAMYSKCSIAELQLQPLLFCT